LVMPELVGSDALLIDEIIHLLEVGDFCQPASFDQGEELDAIFDQLALVDGSLPSGYDLKLHGRRGQIIQIQRCGKELPDSFAGCGNDLLIFQSPDHIKVSEKGWGVVSSSSS